MKHKIFITLFLMFFAVPSFGAADCDATSKDACPAGCQWIEHDEGSALGTCWPCSNGYYTSAPGQIDCDLCTNVPTGATYTGPGTAANNCPWQLTCSADKIYDADGQTCKQCTNGTRVDTLTVTFDGENVSVPDRDANKCKCNAGYYGTDDSTCTKCPAGSTSDAGAESINDCYMDKNAKPFCSMVGDAKKCFGLDDIGFTGNKLYYNGSVE